MSNVAIFKPNETPQYLRSVHEPPYFNDPTALIDPDVSAVQGVDLKYWKRVGDTIVEMNAGEKTGVDNAEKAARIATIEDLQIGEQVLAKALVKAGVISKADLVMRIKEVLGL